MASQPHQAQVEVSDTQPGWNIPPQMLHAPHGDQGSFLDQRQILLDELAEAMTGFAPGAAPNAPMATALIDLARLHYRYGLAPEGLSFLDRLDRLDLPPAHRMQRDVLSLALGLIDPRDLPLSDHATRLLSSTYAPWPDQPVFLALAAIRDGDLTGAGQHLEAARDRLHNLPDGYRAIILPNMLEAAIQNEEWRVARDLADDFHHLPGLSQSAAFHFLLGRAAEAGNDLLAAFDSYTLASTSRDLWGHRARIGLVSMGLRNDLIDATQARDMLRQESLVWRGDDYALTVLEDLAALDHAIGDRVAAVSTYGAILDRFPDRPETELARQKARALIVAIYEEGAAGDLSLSEFLRAHRRIAPDFRFEPGFADQAEAFADRFLAVGSTLVAAREYETIHDHLAVARDLGLQEVEDTRLDSLRIKQAESLMAGGQYDAATLVLADPLISGTEALDDQRLQLLAQLYAETGQTEAVLETTKGEPSASFLRLRADAHFKRENWADAEKNYRMVWDKLGSEMAFEDAVNFLLASYRNGDRMQTIQLSQEFPELTELPQWAEIAESLTREPAQLLPLRQDNAQSRVDDAAQTLQNLESVSSGTN